PAIIYFHGGGLTTGNRRGSVPHRLLSEAKDRGWSLISADYRLLIPASAEEIIEDVKRLFVFISSNIPQIDMNRVAVGGGSAGGYVARLTGLYANPKPKAVYSLYG
ncbi:alpha/beta-hydrolase, partial [Clavulina sp. PMI_390]